MTVQADPDQALVPPGEVPVIICVALDNGDRRRLSTLLDGLGVLMFTNDLATAHSMLGRQVRLRQPVAGPPDPAPLTLAPPDPDRPALTPTIVRAGELEIDQSRCRAHWRDTPLALTQRERRLLACLATAPMRVWTFQQLYRAAWSGRYLDPGPVQAAIKRLRGKLRQAGVPVRVAAVRGVGYELAS